MASFKSPLIENLVNKGQLPEVPVRLDIPNSTILQIGSILVVITSVIIISVIMLKKIK